MQGGDSVTRRLRDGRQGGHRRHGCPGEARRRRLGLVPILLSLLNVVPLLLAVGGCSPTEELSPDRLAEDLVPGRSVEGRLAGGEVHSYRLTAEAGRYLEARVQQQGIDVEVVLEAPGGETVWVQDSPNGDHGLEELLVITPVRGTYHLRVRPLGAEAARGGYQLAVDLRPPGAADRHRVQAESAFAAAEVRRHRGDPVQALELYRQAAAAARQLDEPARLARILRGAGEADLDAGDLPSAGRLLAESRDLYTAAGDLESAGVLENRLGIVRRDAGDLTTAASHFRRARELSRAAGFEAAVAAAEANLAGVYVRLGQHEAAMEAYQRILDDQRLRGDESGEIDTLQSFGYLLLRIDRRDVAEDSFRRALELARRGQRTGDLYRALKGLADTAFQDGRPEEALEPIRESLALRRESGTDREVSAALHTLGNVLWSLGRMEEAERSYDEALGLLGEESQRRWELFLDQGRLAQTTGRSKEAARLYGQARAGFQADGGSGVDRRGLAASHLGLARVLLGQDRPGDALPHSRTALAEVEALRREAGGILTRAAYRAFRQDYYEVHLDVLMELAARHPEAGYGEEAFRIVEQGRARSLLDLLAGTCPAGSLDGEAALLARRERVQAQIARVLAAGGPVPSGEQAAAASRSAPLPAVGSPAAGAAAEGGDGSLPALLLRLDEVEGELSRGCPDPPEPEVLGLAEVRRRVLDPQSLLLVYALGERRSFLWSVSTDGHDVHELPPRKEIAGRVEAARRALESPRVEDPEAARDDLLDLSRLLLGPVAEEKGRRRLLVVADGPLLYLPFAALPDPATPPEAAAEEGGGPPPLLLSHEVVRLPSASVVASLQRRAPRNGSGLAVVADAVYGADDPRLAAAGTAAVPGTGAATRRGWPADLTRSAADLGLAGLGRLPASGREAAAIAEVVGTTAPLPVLRLEGFSADRGRVLEGGLAGYRILHFATHGLLHTDTPELSGLVLSMVGPDGGRRDGFLRSYEIASLDLAAELVVLSACETGLGREMQGEGLVGLSHSFLDAGAPRLVTTLWKVGDVATEAFMRHFYRALVVERRPPAAALRDAQEAMWRDPRWSAPRYWAPFVFEGDWRGFSLDGQEG